jgi:hypothetical protein
VVGVVQARGGGIKPKSEDRSYETGNAAASPPLPALRSEDKARDAVPVPGDAERPLPVTRREGGAPKGNKNNLKHGRYTAEAIAHRRMVGALLREIKGLVDQLEGKA